MYYYNIYSIIFYLFFVFTFSVYKFLDLLDIFWYEIIVEGLKEKIVKKCLEYNVIIMNMDDMCMY